MMKFYLCVHNSSELQNLFFRGLRFRGLRFRGLRFRGLRFRGLRFRGLRFRGLRFRGLRSVVCVFEVCVFETPLMNDRWRAMLCNDVYSRNLCAVAVDEAHVIKQW